jgi:hypothetical protein
MEPEARHRIFVETGRAGARKRWGPPRTVRLDALSLEQRRLVLALIDAAKAATASQPERAA